MVDCTFSYLLVRVGAIYHHYLRLHEGVIEVIRLHKDSDQVQRLRAYPQDLKRAAATYMKSTLPKTEEALGVLNNILSSNEDDQINFLFEQAATPRLEKPTKRERHQSKANELTLEKVCKELGVPPSRARSAFRRHAIKKPSGGWKWPKSEHTQVLAMVKKVLS